MQTLIVTLLALILVGVIILIWRTRPMSTTADTAALATAVAANTSETDNAVAALGAEPTGDTADTIAAVAAATDQLNANTAALAKALAPPALPLTLGPDAAAPAVVGEAYSQSLSETGGTPPFRLEVTGGALPDGLSLDTAAGAVVGTPTASGSFSASITATDAGDPAQTASVSWSWTL